MSKQKEVGECVLLLSPPGFKVLSLIILTRLQSFACQFSSMQVLFSGMGRCIPTDIGSSPCWNHQSKLVQ